jgi:hypothetical protein
MFLPKVGRKNVLVTVPGNPKIIHVGLCPHGCPTFWVEGDQGTEQKIEISVIDDNEAFWGSKEVEHKGTYVDQEKKLVAHLYQHYMSY